LQYTGMKILPNVSATHLLSCKEEQNVSFCLLTHVDLYNCAYRSLEIVSLWFWCVEDLHRVCAARDAHQRCIVKVLLRQKKHRRNETVIQY